MALSEEQMTLLFEANTDRFERGLASMQDATDKHLSAIERRGDTLGDRLEKSFGQAGSRAASRLAATLGAAVSLAGIDRFVSSMADHAEMIERQSKALGISTDAVQEWSMAARHAGVDQDTLNTGLDFFSKNVGLAQLKVTPFGKELTKLGVDIHAGPEKAFYEFMDAVSKVTDVQQRNALVTMGMGRSSVELASFVGQGSEALRAQGEEFKRLGMIIDSEANEKIVKMSRAWEDMKAELTAQVGATVLSGLSDEFGKFTAEMKDPQFQKGLHDFGKILADAALAAAKFGAANWGAIGSAIAGMNVGSKIAGGPGAIIGGITAPAVEELLSHRDQLRAWSLQNMVIPDLEGNIESRQSAPAWDRDSSSVIQKMKDDLARDKAELRVLQDKLAGKASEDNIDSGAAISFAEANAALAAMTGKKQGGIDLSGSLDRAPTPSWLQPVKVTPRVEPSVDMQLQDKQYDLSNKLIDAGQKEVDKLDQQAGAFGLTGGALDAYNYKQQATNELMEKYGSVSENDARIIDFFAGKIKEAGDTLEQQKRTYEDQVAITDELRSGLENVAAAGLHGFSSMRDAAKQFLDQLAELILKLYVMQPLLDAMLGPQGSAGGGWAGSLMSSAGIFGSQTSGTGVGELASAADTVSSGGWLSDAFDEVSNAFGFAEGGIMTSAGPIPLRRYAGGGIASSPQLAVFGEGSGPEAYVPLSHGGIPVNLNMPKFSKMASPSNQTIHIAPVFSIDARGAQIGVAEQIDAKIRAAAPALITESVRQARAEFPTNMSNTLRDCG